MFVHTSVVLIVADYRKIVTELQNQQQSIIDFLHRLLLTVQENVYHKMISVYCVNISLKFIKSTNVGMTTVNKSN
jgi:Holliday junction resolvasome RuvABC ATP-dependent DNA helicase subunit